MIFDFDAITPEAKSKLLHSTIVPRPIAWITSLDAEGRRNMAPFSFFNVFSTDPAILGFSVTASVFGGPKDTAANVRARRDFVVHLVSHSNRAAMNLTGTELPANIDEITLAGLTAVPSERISAPRIAECDVAMECVLHSEVPLSDERSLFLGRVVTMHLADAMVEDAERHYVDAQSLDLIGRMHGRGWYARTTDLYKMDRPITEEVLKSIRAGEASDTRPRRDP